MLQFENLFDFQILIFLLMAIGYLLRRLEIIDTVTRKHFTDLVINVILPANVLNSFLMAEDLSVLEQGVVLIAVSLGIQVAYLFLNMVLYRRATPAKRDVLRYGTICPNAGFIGNPLVEGLYGSTGLLYASLFLIPQRVAMWTLGIACYDKGGGNLKATLIRIATQPCIVVTVIGLALMLFQVSLPSFLTKTVQ